MANLMRTKKKKSVLAFFIEVAISPNFSSKICWAKLQSILLISKYLEKKAPQKFEELLDKNYCGFIFTKSCGNWV